MSDTTTYGWNEASGIPLIVKLRSDLKAAILGRNETVKGAVRIIISEFPTKITQPITLESGKKSSRPKQDEEITNDEIITVIMGLCKSEKQTLEFTGQPTSDYLQVLESYLPRMATEEEIMAWAKENIDLSQFKSPMQAMGPIMKHFGKTADGNVVKKVLGSLAG
ncbi:MAG: GatB/YqeY domain-containing protein [Proteobacteria bacterium]|nr:GatB/YqeY domain-containing protein [Pseudomonadota bacterium]MBU1648068.1 GatB/YqeY domain-containing protein [Pseudomonadota bacterium]MBU1985962.1 GatB/YqeY domain-containing protein [Pseudomonadota bacterium]